VRISKGKIDLLKGQTVVTIGMFDGVHRGHMSLLGRVIKISEESNCESVAISFDPHPRVLLSGGDNRLKFLTSNDEKVTLMEKSGLDNILILDFTEELSRLSTCDFVKEILVTKLNMKHLVIGYDHHFGHRGSGSNLTISECAAKYGFGVTRIDALSEEGEKVSSTRIRRCLEEGYLEQANALLGYDYILDGIVVSGKKIGRGIGYPTANLKPVYDYKLIPQDGVYAVTVEFDGKLYKSMLYIGTRPTLETGGRRIIEANLFDFEGDLYGKQLSIVFKHRIRGDERFESKELLTEQIFRDKVEALRLLG
jgi:riboflavin kinase/FMN adenylyltransferase